MAKIMTVLGPIEPAALGPTLMHEHLFIDLSGPKQDADARLADLDLACREAERLRAAGGAALVEVTCLGMGRQAAWLKEVASRTGLTVIAATGFYQQRFHPAYVAARSAEALAEQLLGEVAGGLDGTDVRPGILAEIGTSKNEITPDEAKVFAAVVQVHRATGLPISTHCTLGTMAAEQVQLLGRLGANLEQVVIGHQDLVDDLEGQVAMAKAGVTIAYDTYGKEAYMPDATRVKLITGMLERGLGDRVVLSLDLTRRSHMAELGGPGYGHLFTSLLPKLRAAGVSEGELNQMLIENPRRLLAH